MKENLSKQISLLEISILSIKGTYSAQEKKYKKLQFITELIDLSNQSHGSPHHSPTTTGVWSSCYYTSSVIFSAINGGIFYIKLKIPKY